MTTEEILRGVCSALRAEGIEAAPRRISALDGREGCVVRPMPARVAVQYINGDMEVEQQVRVIVKRRRAADAMAAAEDAACAMDGLAIAGADGEAVLACSGDMCQELELNDQDFTIWEARATARYTKKGEPTL